MTIAGRQVAPLTGSTPSTDGEQGVAPKPVAGTPLRVLSAAGSWAYPVQESALVLASPVLVNASLGQLFYLLLTTNITVANPTLPTVGQTIVFRFTQDGVGGRSVLWGNKYRFGVDVPQPALSTDPDKTDYVLFRYNSTVFAWDCLAYSRGY